MNNSVVEFQEEKEGRIDGYEKNKSLLVAAKIFNNESNRAFYSYNFAWMVRPVYSIPKI